MKFYMAPVYSSPPEAFLGAAVTSMYVSVCVLHWKRSKKQFRVCLVNPDSRMSMKISMRANRFKNRHKKRKIIFQVEKKKNAIVGGRINGGSLALQLNE